MTTTSAICSANLYCSAVSRQCGEDPIGSASTHSVYLFVEVPLPWDVQVVNSSHFPRGLQDEVKKAADEGYPGRLLAFAPEPGESSAGGRRLFVFRKPCSPFAYFERSEYVVPEPELNELAAAALRNSPGLSQFAKYELKPPVDGAQSLAVRDLFVCTHGSHDRCCGKFGYPMYEQIRDKYASASQGRLRVWRTSHFGGHRHAPTILDLPEGRYWAQIRADLLDALIHRQGSLDMLAAHYRGWGGVGRFEQVAEREVWRREGWNWISYKKNVSLIEESETSARVRIEFRSASGTVRGAYEVDVLQTGTVPISGCGSEGGEAKQYAVHRLIKL